MCKIIADTKKLTHREWLELRKRGIYIAAVILG